MMPAMTAGTIVELLVALALIVGAILLYRRRGRDDPRHGSQTAVLLLLAGILVLLHGLGLLDGRRVL